MIYSALSVILTHHGRKNEKHNVGKIYFGGNKGIPTKDEKFTGVGNYEFQKKCLKKFCTVVSEVSSFVDNLVHRNIRL